MIKLVKEKGIDIHSGPFQPNPHIKYFFVMDPNGLKIQFVGNIYIRLTKKNLLVLKIKGALESYFNVLLLAS